MLMLRKLGVCISLLCFIALAACGGDASPNTNYTTPTTGVQTPTVATTATQGGTTGTNEVKIVNGFAFSPQELTVAVGATVTWVNSTSAPHTVTSDDGKFDLDVSSGSVTHTFTTAGTYPYHCSIHSSMKGTIIVK